MAIHYQLRYALRFDNLRKAETILRRIFRLQTPILLPVTLTNLQTLALRYASPRRIVGFDGASTRMMNSALEQRANPGAIGPVALVPRKGVNARALLVAQGPD